jgi:small-conductance mechanosensitive channel
MQILNDVRTSLEGVATIETRLAVSVIIAIAALVVMYVILPRTIRRAIQTVERVITAADEDSYLTLLEDAVPWSFPTTLVTRLLQTSILVAVTLALLILWGHLGVARFTVAALLDAVPLFTRLLLTIGLLVAGLVGTRILETRLEELTVDSDHITQHEQGIVYRVLQVTVFGAVGLAALSLWNIDLSGLLIGAGFLGIVFGMAARQTLGALIAGFVLMFSRPFEIGDWVLVNEVEGIVTDITIINTRLQSFDGEEVVMPNDTVANGTIVNRTRRGQLRIRTDVGIDYEADLDRAEELARSAIESIDLVAPAPAPQVLPKAFGDSAITLELRYWIKSPSAYKKWQTRQAVVREVKSVYDQNGIDIPYPQRTISTRSADAPEPTGARSPESSDVSTQD